MVRPGTGAGQVVKAAAFAALLCTFALAQSAGPTSASTESTKKPTSHKSSSPAHHSPSTKHSSASKSSSSAHSVSHKGKKSRKSYHRGQQKIDGSRTVQIQEALIKQHYLNGKPSGKWDATTEEALRSYQADNGWQNKTVPDSRALIKLGLGPSHDHLLNPESAMTTGTEPRSPAAGKPASAPPELVPASNQPN
ncbi:MAG TPA: peptidoglycan-binding domain-containing protein [Terriglobales bacterium]|nr:peptidoglycan-binding domain-containing protein [Terriglobales bacterium]